jgi:hypothetical protein
LKQKSLSYQLFEELHSSAGMEYLNRRKRRDFTYNIFRGNYSELKKLCAVVEDPEIGIKLMSQSNQDQGNKAHMEVMRLFHNFLAAAKSLVDHTRVFVDHYYEGTSFKVAYTNKLKNEIAEDSLMKFIHDLRNYMLHRGLPNGSMSLFVTNDPKTGEQTIETTVSIDKEKLLEWKNWTAGSKPFLKDSNAKIKISELSDAYGKKVEMFYEWFDNELMQHHRHDLEVFKKLQRAHAQALDDERLLSKKLELFDPMRHGNEILAVKPIGAEIIK